VEGRWDVGRVSKRGEGKRRQAEVRKGGGKCNNKHWSGLPNFSFINRPSVATVRQKLLRYTLLFSQNFEI